jgi:hypothetical protein
MMKLRIVRRASPLCGSWYVIQKKVLFWWRDLKLYFTDLDKAKHVAMYCGIRHEMVGETKLLLIEGKFVKYGGITELKKI